MSLSKIRPDTDVPEPEEEEIKKGLKEADD